MENFLLYKKLVVIFLFTCLINKSYGQISLYDDWHIQSSYLDDGVLKMKQGETKTIKFNVKVVRTVNPTSGNWNPVNFNFTLRRMGNNEFDWCNGSDEISGQFSITSNDFNPNSADVNKEFTLNVTAGSDSDELHDLDEIMLFVQDNNFGSSCGGWFPVEETFFTDVYYAPGTPTNLNAVRTGNGTNLNVTWTLGSGEVTSVDVQHRVSGGSWTTTNIQGQPTSTTLNNVSLSSMEVRVRAKNIGLFSPWSSVKSVSALSLNAASDVHVYRPYYYNLTWTDPNDPLLTGSIQVQKNGYYGNPNVFYTIGTINDLHATTYELGTLPTGKYRIIFTDHFGRTKISNIADMSLSGPSDLQVFKPYYYNLKWTDPNDPILYGSIQVQKNGYYGDPNAYYTIGTISNLHATTYELGSTVPTGKYRLIFTDNFGRTKMSNVADMTLKEVTDLVIINPYYYNLDWTDPNPSALTGKIEIQKNGYWNDPNAYYTISTIYDLHATGYYLGSSHPATNKYRLKLTDQVGRIVYSNITDAASSGLRQVGGDPESVSLINEQDFKIYPVPAVEVLHIQTKEKSQNFFQILDLNGKILSNGNLQEQGNGEASIDISDLKSGIYFIQVNEDTKKFIVK